MGNAVRWNSRFAIAGVALALLFASFTTVQAQSSDVQALLDRMNRLEADLNNVQRKVYQGRDIPTSSSGVSSGAKLSGGGAAAVLSSRIDGLEDEQRRMTGSAEEVNFALDQMKTRLNKLVLDIDFRLSEIERKLSGGQTDAEAMGNAAAPSILSSQLPDSNSIATNTGSTPTGAVAAGGELPKGTQLLGTLRAPTNSNGGTALPSPSVSQQAQETAIAAVQTSGSPAEQYNRAMTLIREDNYVGAETAFVSFLDQNRQHELAGNAQYWLGETYYVRGDYNNAASSFLNGYQNYPENTKAADNLLKLAMTLGRMEQVTEACATFQQLFKQFADLPSRLKRIADREKLKFSCS